MKKSDAVPSIPQPDAAPKTSKSAAGRQASKTKKQQDNIPTAADHFQTPEPAPEARDAHSTISTSDPQDLGTRVQAVSRKNANEAERFAQEAVSALESTGQGISRVQDLLKETIEKASSERVNSGEHGEHGEHGKQGDAYKHEPSGKEIPKGEKTALLSMLGLTGLWVAFGGKFQKKKAAT